MATTIYKSDFFFHEITEEFKENFKEKSWHDLSDFQSQALKWAGDAIRPFKSQFFWCNGAYCWYTDATQSNECCVWMTTNGILMYEDATENKLYRVEFN
jgi:hypothetical protein